MKEQILMYGVCAAISVVAVAITSLLKIIACAIARRCGKSLSGNAKEYIFTPTALLLAALALYVWLDRFMYVEDEQLFILILSLFSVGTMLIYLLLFQTTRKAARAIIGAIARYFHAEPIVDAVQEVIAAGDTSSEPQKTILHSNAKNAEGESQSADGDSETQASDSEADKLRAMVEAIKKK